MTKKQAKQKVSIVWSVIVPIILVAVFVPLGIMLARQASLNKIDTFEACQEAGGTISEDDPSRCSINDKTFASGTDPSEGEESDSYIGLTEQEALEKAEREDVTARVVERDGEVLTVTMDLAFGRHNFYVKDGEVYRVEVEGGNIDLPAPELDAEHDEEAQS